MKLTFFVPNDLGAKAVEGVATARRAMALKTPRATILIRRQGRENCVAEETFVVVGCGASG
jgi:hypothetical protein